jgi:hypothetical protein
MPTPSTDTTTAAQAKAIRRKKWLIKFDAAWEKFRFKRESRLSSARESKDLAHEGVQKNS